MSIEADESHVLYACDTPGCGAIVEQVRGRMPALTGWLLGPGGARCPECRRAAKVRLELLPLHALAGAARVLAFGDVKHALGDRRRAAAPLDLGDLVDRELGGALRHLAELGERGAAARDEETGAASLDHAIARLLRLRRELQDAGVLEADPGALPVPREAAS